MSVNKSKAKDPYKVTWDNGRTQIFLSMINPRGVASKLGNMNGYGNITNIEMLPKEALNKPQQPKKPVEEKLERILMEVNGRVADVTPPEEAQKDTLPQEDEDLINLIIECKEINNHVAKRIEYLFNLACESNEVVDADFLCHFAKTIDHKVYDLSQSVLKIISNLED